MPEPTVIVLIATFVAAILLLRRYNRAHGTPPQRELDDPGYPDAQ
ncbi:hypothetical protein [Nocardia mexicana]|nr:hypothetical protein [Nocardia mexicana]